MYQWLTKRNLMSQILHVLKIFFKTRLEKYEPN